MIQSSEFCRAQESAQRERASHAVLENVRVIATSAATTWAREAVLAERREQRRQGATSTLPPARSVSEKEDDRLFDLNPDHITETRTTV